MNIQLICVGKLKERFYSEAAAEYIKRLGAFCNLQVTEISETRLPRTPSPSQITAALEKEAAAIRAKLPASFFLSAMCKEGRLYSSEDLLDLLQTVQRTPARHTVFLLGGSYGLDEQLKGEAHRRISMSLMTFPHHLARVMLLEQLYRAFQISVGSHYHK